MDARYRGSALTDEQKEAATWTILKLASKVRRVDQSFTVSDAEILSDFGNYRMKEQHYSRPELWAAAQNEKLSASSWWSALCSTRPLQPIASRLLSVPSSAASMERVWSVFALVHTKKRNRLTNKRVELQVAVACADRCATKDYQIQSRQKFTCLEQNETPVEHVNETFENNGANDLSDIDSDDGEDDGGTSDEDEDENSLSSGDSTEDENAEWYRNLNNRDEESDVCSEDEGNQITTDNANQETVAAVAESGVRGDHSPAQTEPETEPIVTAPRRSSRKRVRLYDLADDEEF